MEERAEAIYGKTGGCEVGRTSWFAKEWTWPFVGLYIYRDQLVLSMSFHRCALPRTAISQIRRYRSGVSLGLKIEHTVSDYPPFMVFCPSDVEEFEEALAANAFPVATPLSR